jgi:hypothetical protein
MALPRNLSNLAQGANSSGVLQTSSGGTGATTLTANNVLLGNGTGSPSFVAPGSNGNVLTSNGTSWISSAAAGGSIINIQYFPTAGTFTYTKTAGTNKILCYCIGGGGGGAFATGQPGGGGGAGGTAVKFISNASAITTLTVVVGSGGSSAAAGNNSTVAFPSPINTITGNGGSGASNRFGGNGGQTANSDINLEGGAGNGGYDPYYNANWNGLAGGYPAMFGVGGGAASYSNSAIPGKFGGGGGGGSYYISGGSGGSGLVVFYEYG